MSQRFDAGKEDRQQNKSAENSGNCQQKALFDRALPLGSEAGDRQQFKRQNGENARHKIQNKTAQHCQQNHSQRQFVSHKVKYGSSRNLITVTQGRIFVQNDGQLNFPLRKFDIFIQYIQPCNHTVAVNCNPRAGKTNIVIRGNKDIRFGGNSLVRHNNPQTVLIIIGNYLINRQIVPFSQRQIIEILNNEIIEG